MKLPWFLNPWAEVRRLRGFIGQLGHILGKEAEETRRVQAENADLRRRIAEMEEQAGIEQRRTDYIRRTAM